jgi:hypothetical protein
MDLRILVDGPRCHSDFSGDLPDHGIDSLFVNVTLAPAAFQLGAVQKRRIASGLDSPRGSPQGSSGIADLEDFIIGSVRKSLDHVIGSTVYSVHPVDCLCS